MSVVASAYKKDVLRYKELSDGINSPNFINEREMKILLENEIFLGHISSQITPGLAVQSSLEQLSSDCSVSSENTARSYSSSDQLHSATKISREVRQRALENKVSHKCVDNLLRALNRSHMQGLPLCARKLLHTYRTSIKILNIASGQYYHFGIQNYLQSKSFSFLRNILYVVIDISIDGVNLLHSSRAVLWPIIGVFPHFKNENPFLFGCFSGTSKPSSVNEYLKMLAEEIIELKAQGILIGKNPIRKMFKIRAFICDSPARSFITGTQYPTGEISCPKCVQKGFYIKKRIAFQ